MDNEFIEIDLNDTPASASLNRAYHSILDKLPRGIEQWNVWFGGGCYVRVLGGELLSDVDFYASSRDDLANLSWFLRRKGFKIYFCNKNAIKGYIEGKNHQRVNIDIVKRIFKNEIETILNFDFSVTKIVTNASTKKGYYYQSSFIDILQKRLVFPHQLPAPIGTLKRMQKYIRRGFVACDGTMLTLAKAIAAVNFDDPIQNPIEFYPDGRKAIPKWD